MSKYRLKLKRLDFISAVDAPAQETAKVLLIKRAPNGDGMEGPARVVKLSDELGLVFCWAFTSKAAGQDYFDLHGDNVVEEDLVKTCAEFMANGGHTDEMHDSEPDGRVVFAMPMTAEVAKAFGVQTDTFGFMVAVKPSAEVFAKFKSGEYTGVSLAGIGERVAARKSIAKQALYTTEVDGHQHLIDLCCFDESGTGYTSYNTAEGADYGHSHAVARAPDGSLTILADSGHTHELAPDQPAVVVVPADAIVVVSAHKSPRPAVVGNPGLTSQENPMPTEKTETDAKLTAKIDELQKKLEHAEHRARLTDAQKAYYRTLGAADGEAYLAKSDADREADVAVEYTSKSDGTVYRKSDDPRLVEMAKRQDKLADDLAKRDEDLEKSETAALAKSVLGHVAGEDEVHAYIVKAIRKGGGNAAMIEKALTALRGANAAAQSAAIANGFNPGAEPAADSPEGALEVIAKRIATEQKVDIAKARDLALDTAEGRAAYAEMSKRRTHQPSA